MYLHDIGRNRYRVHKSRDDNQICGIVERHEYVSISMATGERVTKRFWRSYGKSGWREMHKGHFPTAEAAAASLIKDAAIPYGSKQTRWSKRYGS